MGTRREIWLDAWWKVLELSSRTQAYNRFVYLCSQTTVSKAKRRKAIFLAFLAELRITAHHSEYPAGWGSCMRPPVWSKFERLCAAAYRSVALTSMVDERSVASPFVGNA